MKHESTAARGLPLDGGSRAPTVKRDLQTWHKMVGVTVIVWVLYKQVLAQRSFARAVPEAK